MFKNGPNDANQRHKRNSMIASRSSSTEKRAEYGHLKRDNNFVTR
jgi:hypothetical protein